MSRQVLRILSGFYGVFDMSGTRISVQKRSKKTGHYSNGVSTNSSENIKRSTSKVANAMRKAHAELV